MKTTAKMTSTSSGACSTNESGALIQSVLDLLPGYDPNLIKKCLEYYENNVEQVINAILENNLPEFMVETKSEPVKDESEISEMSEDDDCVTSKFSELALRKNIYDGDQFDVFTKKEVNMSNIYLGKKNEIERLDLNDKSEIDREFFRNYDQIMHERMLKEQAELEGNFLNEYEDEYDDTYDDKATANDEAEPYEFINPLNKKLEGKKRDTFDVNEDEGDGDDNDKNSFTKRNNQQQYGQKEYHSNQNSELKRSEKPQYTQSRGNYNQQSNRNQHSEQRSNNNMNQRDGAKNQSQFSNQHNDQRSNNNMNQRDGAKNQSQFSNQHNDQRSESNRTQRDGNKNESFQKQQPLPQRAPKQQRPQQQRESNSNQQHFDKNLHREPNKEMPKEEPSQYSQKFQDKYARSSQATDNNPDVNTTSEKSQETPKTSELLAQKTADQIKRDRKWKNDHKNSHRKDQAAKKTNFF